MKGISVDKYFIELAYLQSYMLKNGYQLTMGVYRVITFLFPLIRVKLSVDFEFSYDQLDPVSLNSALWPDSITPNIFFFA